jgi:integrase
MTTRQYARLLSEWIANIGLDPKLFGTHSLRRTKATLIYRRTGYLRAVQLLLGHTKIESTSRSNSQPSALSAVDEARRLNRALELTCQGPALE